MSEDPDFVFHRTLLPYASQPRRATIEEPRFLQTPKEPFPAFPIRPVTTPPRAQAFNPSFKSVPLNGYQIVVPGSLTSRVFQVDPDGLPDADGRHFAQYATPWERLRSKICSRGFRFLPVVDHDHVVVGHAGRVSGYDLLIAATANTSPTDLADAMQHARLYVSSSPPGTTPPQGMKRWGFSDDIYDVVTAIDGEVVTGGLAYSRGVQEDDHILADPLLAWSVMRVAARFALKAGALVVRSVGRRIARRTILDGARAEILATSASSPYARGLKTSIGYDARMGIPPEHFEPMAAAAREANGIAVFRANKSAAIDLIRKGAAPKPKAFNDFKSSLTTGVVTAKTSGHFKTVWEQGYLVIEEDFVARRRVGSVVVQEMKVERPY